MHRLREWFGIKDWQGPPPKQNNGSPQKQQSEPTSNTDPNKAEKDTKSQKVNEGTKVLPTSQNVTIPKLASPPQKESMYDKTETWLKKYIPHKEDTCFGCKLVAMTTVMAWSIAMASVTVTQAKKFNHEYKRLFIFIGFSATSLGLSYLHLLTYDQDPMEPFRRLRKKQDEE